MARWQDQDGLIKIVILLFSSICCAVALNEFLIPSDIFSGGLNGIAQLLHWGLVATNIHVSTGWFILAFNLPIGIMGWHKIGPKFTAWSFANAIVTSILAIVIPEVSVSHNALLNALFGGILTGIGIGFPFRFGFSTGGMDIIAMVLQKTTGRSIGTLTLLLNSGIVAVAGFFIGWENALFTIITIYATSRMVDTIHTRHQKMTALIVTSHPEEMIQDLRSHLFRGITVLPSRGGFSNQTNATLMIVISRYELYDLKNTVNRIDPESFMDLVTTVDVSGNFFDEATQERLRQMRNRVE
ncbi:YitT family protein [Furfurilactobacillus curtus]|uniref:Membrane protein n=1 Tax=Furfurilactobacillus curtus TaxID=1746200 RepID=A0ABQ5JN75_9LACO